MNLTQKQLEQCRKEFDDWWVANTMPGEIHGCAKAREAFQAAWRPIPSVEEIKDYTDDVITGRSTSLEAAIDIHRALGGKE